MSNKEKAEEISLKYAREYMVSRRDSHKQNILFKESSIIECEKAAMEMAQWKDEHYKEREEGLLETINALEIRLKKTQESGMYFFDQYNVQKQQLIDKACKFLKSYCQDTPDGLGYIAGIVNDKTIEDFKKYMEGE